MNARPIGRTCFVSLLPESPKSSLLEVVSDTESLVRRAVVTTVGPKCKTVQVGQTYLVRASLGVQVGDALLLPEVACLALIPA